MAELPTGTVTFLFTDIEGSTQLLKRLGERYGETLADHQALLRAAFDAHDGAEIDTQGDSFFVAFPSAGEAVRAAIESQRTLAEHEWPDGADLRVRMGVHTGRVSVADGRYVGLPVHRAARIAAAGHGGQILVSQTTERLLEEEPDEGVVLRDLGSRRLKDIDQPVRLYQVLAPGLRRDFPALRTLDAERARRHRRLLALGAPALVLAALPVAFLLTRGGESVVTVRPNSVAVIDPDSNDVVGSVPVGALPGPVAVGEGSVWVANLEDRSVSRIDPASRSVERTIALEGSPTGLAVGEGAVWIVYGRLGTVSSVDPQFNTVGEPIDLRLGPGLGPIVRGSVAVGNGAVWVVFGISVVVRLDPVSRRVVATGVAGDGPSAIDVGEESVWVANATSSTVSRLNPRTAFTFTTFNVGQDPSGVAVGGGAVWVSNKLDDSVARIDPESGSQSTIGVGDGPTGIAVGEGAVWVANSADGTVSRIDLATEQVTATIELGGRPEGVAVGSDAVWVTAQAP
jgi:YVTN family beta-propeller protein